MGKGNKKPTANNKEACFDYFIFETFETGVELSGTEVKALRMGHCLVKENRVDIRDEEILIYRMHIGPYEKGNIFDKDPLRVRKLPMHKSEARRLIGTIKEKGFTLVLLEVYLKGRFVRVEIGLTQGKKRCDKCATIVKNGARRDLERNFRGSMRY